MEMLDIRLNDKGKNWRHISKARRPCAALIRRAEGLPQALTLIDYLLHSGSPTVITYFQQNAYLIRTLSEFVHVDEDGKDNGANVRLKAREVANLLGDEERLKAGRGERERMRERLIASGEAVAGAESSEAGGSERQYQPPPGPPPRTRRSRKSRTDPDADLLRAIEESKKTAEAEGLTAEERQLFEALKLSEEEEKNRKAQGEGDDVEKEGLFDFDEGLVYVALLSLSPPATPE
jgi:epsin